MCSEIQEVIWTLQNAFVRSGANTTHEHNFEENDSGIYWSVSEIRFKDILVFCYRKSGEHPDTRKDKKIIYINDSAKDISYCDIAEIHADLNRLIAQCIGAFPEIKKWIDPYIAVAK